MNEIMEQDIAWCKYNNEARYYLIEVKVSLVRDCLPSVSVDPPTSAKGYFSPVFRSFLYTPFYDN